LQCATPFLENNVCPSRLFFESHHGVVFGATEGSDSNLVLLIAITGASSENDFISPLEPRQPFPCAGPRFLADLSTL
jgi:hypothetical protein